MPLSWLDIFDDQIPALKDLLMSWASVNSGSMHTAGLLVQAQLLDRAFAGISEYSEHSHLPGYSAVDDQGQITQHATGPLLTFCLRPEAPKQVLLCGHMDTVFGEDHTFQKPQWRDDNMLVGPGVADMKGGLLIILTALQLFENSPHAMNLGWTLMINPDEELGSLSSGPLLQEACLDKDFGLVFEPSVNPEGAFAGERKGSGKLIVVVGGRAAHAGRHFHEGRNAIVHLSKIIQAIDGLNDRKPGLTLNVGIMQGGQAVNQVPDRAIARIDIRYQDPQEKQWLDEQLNRIQLEYTHVDYTISFHPQFTRPPKPMNDAQLQLFHRLKLAAQQLGQAVNIMPTGGVCDGNLLSAAGLPNIDTLGVRGGGLHTDQEYMFFDSVLERAKLTALLLSNHAE